MLTLASCSICKKRKRERDEYCETIICLTVLPLQTWHLSSLFLMHNSFWQLHRHAICLLWHANYVYQRSQGLFAGSRHSYADTSLAFPEEALSSCHCTHRPAGGSDPHDKLKKSYRQCLSAGPKTQRFDQVVLGARNVRGSKLLTGLLRMGSTQIRLRWSDVFQTVPNSVSNFHNFLAQNFLS